MTNGTVSDYRWTGKVVNASKSWGTDQVEEDRETRALFLLRFLELRHVRRTAGQGNAGLFMTGR